MTTSEELDRFRSDNERLLMEISTDGYGIDPVQILKLRVDVITDMLISSGLLDDSTLELLWERNLNAALDGMAAEIRTAKLTDK